MRSILAVALTLCFLTPFSIHASAQQKQKEKQSVAVWWFCEGMDTSTLDAKSKIGQTLYFTPVFSTQEDPSFLADATVSVRRYQNQFYSYLVNQYPKADFGDGTECIYGPDFDKVSDTRKEVIKEQTDHFLGYTSLVIYTRWSPDK